MKIASVDAYASSYGEAMEAGMLDYLAGKFSASIGPIFIATYRAALGAPIRTADGNALALSQGYWIAENVEDFGAYYAVDSSVESPAYTKDLLDTLLTADYATFEKSNLPLFRFSDNAKVVSITDAAALKNKPVFQALPIICSSLSVVCCFSFFSLTIHSSDMIIKRCCPARKSL